MTLDEALAEIEHMRALLEASAMLDRDKDAEIERLIQIGAAMAEEIGFLHDQAEQIAEALEAAEAAEGDRVAAMKERCARVADAQIRTWGGSPAALIATAIRNLPDTDGDGNATGPR